MIQNTAKPKNLDSTFQVTGKAASTCFSREFLHIMVRMITGSYSLRSVHFVRQAHRVLSEWPCSTLS